MALTIAQLKVRITTFYFFCYILIRGACRVFLKQTWSSRGQPSVGPRIDFVPSCMRSHDSHSGCACKIAYQFLMQIVCI
jgi:hypothetical protein